MGLENNHRADRGPLDALPRAACLLWERPLHAFPTPAALAVQQQNHRRCQQQQRRRQQRRQQRRPAHLLLQPLLEGPLVWVEVAVDGVGEGGVGALQALLVGLRTGGEAHPRFRQQSGCRK